MRHFIYIFFFFFEFEALHYLVLIEETNNFTLTNEITI